MSHLQVAPHMLWKGIQSEIIGWWCPLMMKGKFLGLEWYWEFPDWSFGTCGHCSVTLMGASYFDWFSNTWERLKIFSGRFWLRFWFCAYRNKQHLNFPPPFFGFLSSQDEEWCGEMHGQNTWQWLMLSNYRITNWYVYNGVCLQVDKIFKWKDYLCQLFSRCLTLDLYFGKSCLLSIY